MGNARGAGSPRRPKSSLQQENGQSDKLGHVHVHNEANRHGTHGVSSSRVAAGRDQLRSRSSFPCNGFTAVPGYRPTVSLHAATAMASGAPAAPRLACITQRRGETDLRICGYPSLPRDGALGASGRGGMVGRAAIKSRVPSIGFRLSPMVGQARAGGEVPIPRLAGALRCRSFDHPAGQRLRHHARARLADLLHPLRSVGAFVSVVARRRHAHQRDDRSDQCPSSRPTEEFFPR